jgi:hypothetical protein
MLSGIDGMRRDYRFVTSRNVSSTRLLEVDGLVVWPNLTSLQPWLAIQSPSRGKAAMKAIQIEASKSLRKSDSQRGLRMARRLRVRPTKLSVTPNCRYDQRRRKIRRREHGV